MSKVWCVKGQDPWAAYRLVGQEPDQYRYSLGKVSFWSPEKRIPAKDFHKIINHFGSKQHSCEEIRSIERKHQVSKVLLNASVNTKQTITGGSHFFNVPSEAACSSKHS